MLYSVRRPLLAFAIAAAPIAGAAAAADPQPSGDLERCLAILDQLEAAGVSVEFRAEPLARVVADLDRRLPVPLRADWDALAGLVVSDDDEVTLRLNSVPATTVLAGITMQLGDTFARPTFEVYAGQIVLTSLGATEHLRFTDAYDVRDLLAGGRALEDLREHARHGAAEPTPAADAAPAGDNPAGEPDPDEQLGEDTGLPSAEELLQDTVEAPPPSPGEELMLLIAEHVDPEAWLELGGGRARISERDGVVLVTASATLHRKFRDVLVRLRQANPRGVMIEAVLLELPRSTLDELSRRYGMSQSMLARAVHRAGDAELLWQATGTVALDERWAVRSAWDDMTVRLDLTPHLDRETGVLRLVVELGTEAGADRRTVQTTASVANKGGAALLELPAAEPGGPRRLLVLLPRRI